MMTWIHPAGSDRYVRHQLVFELVTAGTLAVATGSWALVALVGGIALPAVRATWVDWIRSGLGVWPSVIAMLLATSWGLGAVTVVWLAACSIGMIRQWLRRCRPDRAEAQEVACQR